ncbi:MAG TPA: Uma2 family endonuclease [Spirochaetia bacterium]|nr:Uma2 family endonuclease [Spirochaetia bacterium]
MTAGLNVIDDRVYTIEDYMKLDDDSHYELIGGKLLMVPSPTRKHQKISSRLNTQFENYLTQNPIGEVLWDFDVHFNDKVARPDVLFVSKERMAIIGELNVQGAPDLVVEVLSLSTAAHDRKTKSQLYYENGVKEYWIVDPDGAVVEVFVPGEKNWTLMGAFDHEDVLTTTLLPGLKIKLQDVFA